MCSYIESILEKTKKCTGRDINSKVKSLLSHLIVQLTHATKVKITLVLAQIKDGVSCLIWLTEKVFWFLVCYLRVSAEIKQAVMETGLTNLLKSIFLAK